MTSREHFLAAARRLEDLFISLEFEHGISETPDSINEAYWSYLAARDAVTG